MKWLNINIIQSQHLKDPIKKILSCIENNTKKTQHHKRQQRFKRDKNITKIKIFISNRPRQQMQLVHYLENW